MSAFSGSRDKMKRTTKTRMPQVAVLLESSRGISRAMFQGILNYVRVYGPWSLNIVAGGANDQKVPDTRIWRGNGIIARVPNDEAAQAVVAAKLPAVLINPAAPYLASSHPLSSFSRIQSDSHAIGTLAAEHYLGLGFSVFAFIGSAEQTNWSRWRQDAFRDRLAAADGGLGPQALHLELEGGLGVVIKTAHHSMVYSVGKPEVIKGRPHSGKVVAAIGAEEIRNHGNLSGDFPALLQLAVQDAQGVCNKPPLTIFTEPRLPALKEFKDCFPEGGAAGGASEGI